MIGLNSQRLMFFWLSSATPPSSIAALIFNTVVAHRHRKRCRDTVYQKNDLNCGASSSVAGELQEDVFKVGFFRRQIGDANPSRR